jgi:soluble lytic murein transglycosylase
VNPSFAATFSDTGSSASPILQDCFSDEALAPVSEFMHLAANRMGILLNQMLGHASHAAQPKKSPLLKLTEDLKQWLNAHGEGAFLPVEGYESLLRVLWGNKTSFSNLTDPSHAVRTFRSSERGASSLFGIAVLAMVLGGSVGAGSAWYLLSRFWGPSRAPVESVVEAVASEKSLRSEPPVTIVRRAHAPSPVVNPKITIRTSQTAPVLHLIYLYARKYDVDPFRVMAIIHAESGYDKNAESGSKARGLMQLKPKTGRWVAGLIGMKDFKDEDLNDRDKNLELGCAYLKILKKMFPNAPRVVLLAFLEGQGAAPKYLVDNPSLNNIEKIPLQRAQDYIRKVEAREAALKAKVATENQPSAAPKPPTDKPGLTHRLNGAA